MALPDHIRDAFDRCVRLVDEPDDDAARIVFDDQCMQCHKSGVLRGN